MLESKINVSMNKDLRKKYGIRQFPIVKGDIVKIISGSRKGEGGKVIDVSHKSRKISIEGVTIAKADGKQVAYYIDHSNLVITKLDLSRPGRYNYIKDITARHNLPPPEEPKAIEDNEELPEETTEEPEVIDNRETNNEELPEEESSDEAAEEEANDEEPEEESSDKNDNDNNVKKDGDNDEN